MKKDFTAIETATKMATAMVAMLVIATIIVCVLLFTPISSRAELIEKDWQVDGDTALTYDTASGLEWLDLPYTWSLIISCVTDHFAVGGRFEGFRYATMAEFSALIKQFGIDHNLSISAHANTYELIDLIGLPHPRCDYAVGYLEGLPDFIGPLIRGEIRVNSDEGQAFFWVSPENYHVNNRSHRHHGHFIVRVAGEK